MKNNILSNFYESLKPVQRTSRHNSDIYTVPCSKTKADSHRISIFLPECMNTIIRYSHMISLSDFKVFITFYILNFHQLFLGIRSKLKSKFALDPQSDTDE